MSKADLDAIQSDLAVQMRCMASFLLAMSDFIKAAGHIMTDDELAGFSCCVAEVRGKRLLLNMLAAMEEQK